MLVITSCVCHKYYLPSNSKDENIGWISDNGANLIISIPLGTPNDVDVCIWFDTCINKKVDNIILGLELDKGEELVFKNVSMYCENAGIKSSFVEALQKSYIEKYQKTDFSNLPQEDRYTKLEGNRVEYDFKYTSRQSIVSKHLKFSYNILLTDNNDTTRIENTCLLKLRSRCRYQL